MLIAAFLRISFLGSKSLWLDEGQSAHVAMLRLHSLLEVLTHGQMNMSLYYLMLHLWISIAGSTEFILRLPSAVIDVVTVPLLYLLGAELENRQAGLLAAFLLSINATSIHYAQTARSYSMLVALVTLGSVFFIRSLKRDSPFNPTGYVVSGSAGIYAHLFGIWALPAQWLSLFLFRPSRKVAIRLTLCMLTTATLGAPAFYFAVSGDHGNVDWIPRTNIHSVVNLFFFYCGAFAFNESATVQMLLLLGLYLAGFTAAVRLSPRSDKSALGYLVLSITVPIVLTILVSLVKPIFLYRYLLPGLPAFALLAAIGFQRMRPALAIVLVLAVSLLSLGEDYAYYTAPSSQDWRSAVAFIATHSQPGDELVMFPGFYNHTIGYYVSRLDRPDMFPIMVPEASEGKVRDIIDKLLAASRQRTGTHRIWLTFPAKASTASTRDQEVPQDTFRHSGVVDEPHFSGVRLLLFEANAND